jgi:pimeloyl-ACP methyl ester carboxylesterase
MTVEQFVSDLDELVTYVCTRVGTTNVSLFGHSWGSALGVLYAARFPKSVAVYVGSGRSRERNEPR